MPGLSAPERKKTAFLAGSSCGKAAPQLASARCPRALFDTILRSQFELARALCDQARGREQALDLLAQSSRIAAELHMRALRDQAAELRAQLLDLA